MKGILVTGANGQLGNELRLVSRNSADHYIFTDVAELDITDLDAVRRMVKEAQVDVIVNCAAYTNVDKAESEPDLAEQLNGKAPGNLALAMKEVNGLLIHISTDYVFGGESHNTPITEDCQGKPTGVYGLTKLHGEQNIIRSGARYLIIRTGWLYSAYGKNFVKTMLQLTAERPQLKVVFDQVGTPTYAHDLAEAIKVILNASPIDSLLTHDLPGNDMGECPSVTARPCHSNVGLCEGLEMRSIRRSQSMGGQNIYHYSNEGVTSWYDFAKTIAAYAGHTACDIQPCHSSEFPSPVKRPAYSVLDKTKIKTTFGIQIPYWTDSLRRCLAELKRD